MNVLKSDEQNQQSTTALTGQKSATKVDETKEVPESRGKTESGAISGLNIDKLGSRR